MNTQPSENPTVYGDLKLRSKAEILKLKAQSHINEDPSLRKTADLIRELHEQQTRLQNQYRELVKSKAELEVTKQHYADLFEEAPVGYILSDEQGRVKAGNKSFRKLLKVHGQNLHALDLRIFLSPEQREHLTSHYRDVLASGGIQKTCLSLQLPDPREELLVVLESVLVKNPDPNTEILIRSSVVDFTEEFNLRIQLERALERANEATEAKNRFLANMSHELRTPMNSILGLIELFDRSNLTCEQNNFLHTIESCGKDLMHVLGDILSLASIEAGKLNLDERSFCLEDSRDCLQSMFLPQAKEKGLEFRVDIDKASIPEYLVGDLPKIKEIFCNLVGNAIKFTQKGGVTVKVQGRSEQDTCHLSIAVQDTGIGIDTPNREKILQPFEQATKDISSHFGGSGLGLSIVDNFVALMKGSLRIDSQPGQGSCFTVTLPLRHGVPPEQDLQEILLQPEETVRHSILVVDDNPINLHVFHRMLQKFFRGDLHLLNSGVEALEAVKRHRFDLILMDLEMGSLHGTEATRRIHAYEDEHGLCRTKVVALTANVMEKDRLACASAGMVGFITKPATLEKLKRSVLKALQS